MTDEARIARLTELARRVWPDADAVMSYSEPMNHGVVVLDPDKDTETYALGLTHPRSLDALEAALLVLLDEVEFRRRDPIREVTAVGPTGIEFADGGELRIKAEESPAWVEQLAKEWHREAAQTTETQRAATWERCARELRERAQGKP